MLTAPQWVELSVFEHHTNNLKCKHDLTEEEKSVISYFEKYVGFLKKGVDSNNKPE